MFSFWTHFSDINNWKKLKFKVLILSFQKCLGKFHENKVETHKLE